MVRGVVALVALLSFCANAQESPPAGKVPLKPNPEITTGDFCDRRDNDFEGTRYKEKVAICYRDVSRDRKTAVYRAYGIPDRCRPFFTVDHYIPLSMGGSNQVQNLWPEHKDIKATRQNLEQETYEQLANGHLTQEQALHIVTHAKQHPPHVVPRGCN